MDDEERKKDFLDTYDRYSDAIFRHLYFRLSNREIAKDCMQETFMKTWQYIASGGEIENMRAFLYRIANNLVVDEMRKKKSASLDQLMEAGFMPVSDVGPSASPEKLQQHIDAQEVYEYVQKLHPEDRKLVVMRYIDDLLPNEIAAILQEDVNVISVRLHRAIQKLRNFFPHG